MIDGVRPEQRDFADRYYRYMRNLVMEPVFYHRNVLFVPFAEFTHQVGMLRKVLETIKTPLILFCEQDTPLVTDYVLPMKEISEAILSGDVNSIRFLHEAHILEEHEYLMGEKIKSHGVPLTKTIQFSARPHVASVEFYKKLLERFSPDARCFVEDKAHSICQTDPWDEWRLSIFTPNGNMKRSYHTDGRAGAAKFDDKQVF
jgi:hypothetical protein